jgi:hypothetical protein
MSHFQCSIVIVNGHFFVFFASLSGLSCTVCNCCLACKLGTYKFTDFVNVDESYEAINSRFLPSFSQCLNDDNEYHPVNDLALNTH